MQDTHIEITEKQWQDAVERVERLRDKRLERYKGKELGLIPGISVSCYSNLLMQYKVFNVRTAELYDKMTKVNEHTNCLFC